MSSTQYEQSDTGKESTSTLKTSNSIILGEIIFFPKTFLQGKNTFIPRNFLPNSRLSAAQKSNQRLQENLFPGNFFHIQDICNSRSIPTRKENMFTPKKLSFPKTFFHNLGFKEHTSREVEPVSRKLSFPLQLFCSSPSHPQNYLSSAQPLEEDPDGFFL